MKELTTLGATVFITLTLFSLLYVGHRIYKAVRSSSERKKRMAAVYASSGKDIQYRSRTVGGDIRFNKRVYNAPAPVARGRRRNDGWATSSSGAYEIPSASASEDVSRDYSGSGGSFGGAGASGSWDSGGSSGSSSSDSGGGGGDGGGGSSD